jgi:PPM family protein phosphatase
MSVSVMPFRLQAHGASDIGLVRVNNEDAWLISLEKQIFLLADGLGGHQSGEVASRESVECFFAIFSAWKKEWISGRKKDDSVDPLDIEDSLRQCFAQTNAYLYQLSLSHELLRGMGTTFCSLSFHENMIAVSHVGDSRIYLLRDNALVQITKDHCWTRGATGDHLFGEGKGVLTKALGTTPFVEPTITVIEGRHKDLYLLCSDGLSDMLDHGQIEKILRLPLTVGERVRTLISTAKENGGVDNITVVLVEVGEEHGKNIS